MMESRSGTPERLFYARLGRRSLRTGGALAFFLVQPAAGCTRKKVPELRSGVTSAPSGRKKSPAENSCRA